MRDTGKLLNAASVAMLEKLDENAHKPEWEGLCLRELHDYLSGEMIEIDDAISNHKSLEEIRREAADVANYAAMIIQFCDRGIEYINRAGKSGFALNTGNRYGGGYGD